MCGGGNNDVQCCNQDFDALITQAAGEPDQDKQVALYKQAQTILTNDAAYSAASVPTVVTNEVQPYIGGLCPSRRTPACAGDLFYETVRFVKKH